MRPRRIPSAVVRVEHELLLDVAARERLVRAAAHMRLALLDDAAIGEQRADLAGEIVGVRIFWVDPGAPFRGGPREPRLLPPRRREGGKPDMSAQATRADGIR